VSAFQYRTGCVTGKIQEHLHELATPGHRSPAQIRREPKRAFVDAAERRTRFSWEPYSKDRTPFSGHPTCRSRFVKRVKASSDLIEEAAISYVFSFFTSSQQNFLCGGTIAMEIDYQSVKRAPMGLMAGVQRSFKSYRETSDMPVMGRALGRLYLQNASPARTRPAKGERKKTQRNKNPEGKTQKKPRRNVNEKSPETLFNNNRKTQETERQNLPPFQTLRHSGIQSTNDPNEPLRIRRPILELTSTANTTRAGVPHLPSRNLDLPSRGTCDMYLFNLGGR